MLTNYDFRDMSKVLRMVRYDVTAPENPDVLSRILPTVSADPTDVDGNTIRAAVSSVGSLDKEKWAFAFHNNFYVDLQPIKNGNVYVILRKCLTTLIALLESENHENAKDLSDAIHVLPSMIADNYRFEIPGGFWRVYIKQYRKKWDSRFLYDEQKAYKKYLGKAYIN